MDITNILIDAINNQTPISFSKYGDGEFACATSHKGYNCDRDEYTEKKSDGLIASFKYMVDEMPNSYIGLWHDKRNSIFWENLITQPIKFTKYHTFIMYHNYEEEDIPQKVELFKTIKHSPMKKIYVCNPLLEKAKILLDIDFMVHVPLNNWFDNQFDDILNQIKLLIQSDTKYIIMISAGMGAKILICELSKLFPDNIYLDFGSAIDFICTKKKSRGWEPSYDTFMTLLKDLIPDNWNDPKYEYIYNEAIHKIGVHI